MAVATARVVLVPNCGHCLCRRRHRHRAADSAAAFAQCIGTATCNRVPLDFEFYMILCRCTICNTDFSILNERNEKDLNLNSNSFKPYMILCGLY